VYYKSSYCTNSKEVYEFIAEALMKEYFTLFFELQFYFDSNP